MAERLTRNNKVNFYFHDEASNMVYYKLQNLEDIMEKYGIEDLEQLDIMLFCLSGETKFQLKQLQKLYKKYNIRNVEELAKRLADANTWKRACELACEREDDCYVYDNIHRAYEFYQQAKIEGNDE